MTPHSVGRCPKDRGDRSLLGKPFFKRFFLNKKCKSFYMSTEVMSQGFFHSIPAITSMQISRAFSLDDSPKLRRS